MLQKTSTEKEPPSSGRTGSKCWADISVSPVLLQKEPPLSRLHVEEEKRLFLSPGFRDYSENTSQNKAKRHHRNKNLWVLSGKRGKTTYFDSAVVRPARPSGVSVQMEHIVVC